jgi:NADH-quinone oxidoreductase subunit M
MLNDHLLEVLIWVPIVGGFLILGLGDRPSAARWVSLGVSIVTFAFSIPLWAWFKTGTAEM